MGVKGDATEAAGEKDDDDDDDDDDDQSLRKHFEKGG